eukprot:scaffold16813_cov89-Isochrysis_galbana.AAC.1
MSEAASPALAEQSEAASVEQRPCRNASVIASISWRTARSPRLPSPVRPAASSSAAEASAGPWSACLPTLEAAAAALRHARSTHCAHSHSTSHPPAPSAHTRLAMRTEVAHARAASAAACRAHGKGGRQRQKHPWGRSGSRGKGAWEARAPVGRRGGQRLKLWRPGADMRREQA